ncbi:hypothetical protein GQ43DRAFT_59630 [Delitschia confertaspora ATCC 74209]|uniref:Uncharacterized protein n=1 Tax=Delitschia confertaspora ATCC 74209 TaxID=1513339 RepID=A0A9P4JTA6_9PLEO|nr:hypothetical protein GQ43DRAFT_59630 [Delitschia confertaspora ATCC 74209]
MSDSEEAVPSFRTPLTIVIKTITTHAFALANYACISSLLRRPMKSHIQALRILFFVFVPTLPLVELIINAVRSLLQFLSNYEDDDEIHLRYYLSSAVGMHATVASEDDSPSLENANTERGDAGPEDPNSEEKKHTMVKRGQQIPLLLAGSHCAENRVKPLDWTYLGKLLALVFSLTQAVGTIVMWVRRMKTNDANALSFDHRNGAMGVASTICGIMCLVVILLRLDWKVSRAFSAPQKGYYADPAKKFAVESLLAIFLHVFIAITAGDAYSNHWMYTSIGVIFFLLSSHQSHFRLRTELLVMLPNIALILFIWIFRKEVAQKLGLEEGRLHNIYRQVFPERRRKRAQALLSFLLALWIITDIIRLFVVDILQVVEEWQNSSPHHEWGGYWWQDPISDSIFVI